jgi:hypothetical protein
MIEKKYKRNCPKCEKEIFYTTERTMLNRHRKNIFCKSCSRKNKKRGRYNVVHKIYRRNCPICNFIINYKSYYTWYGANKGNRACMNCRKEKLKIKAKEQFKNGMPEKDKKKISKTLKIKFNTSEYKEKFKKQNGGKNNPMYGKHHSTDTINKCREFAMKQFENGMPTETKEKISQGLIKSEKFYLANKNPQRCQKIRLKIIKRIEERKGQCNPNYNPKSIPILENKAKELGITDLQHAENGGEYRIKELGYTVDGYSPSKNIVIEYYEKRHKNHIEKDEKRKNEIMNYLNCDFIEIKEWE